MKVKCILSHEKPAGVFYEEGAVYEMEKYDKRYFKPVRDTETEKAPVGKSKKTKQMYN